MRTTRAYLDDPYCRDWTAAILRRVPGEGRVGLVLDSTCFYPGGGGQPPDQGWIDGQPLLDITDGADIIHWMADAPAAEQVECRLDWTRRLDYMQQHTGQHILSAAFESELDADTVSFHLGEEVVTVDLPRTDLAPEDIARVERAANRVVMADLPLEVHSFEPGEPIPFPLRKPPTVTDAVRIVAIEGVDYSPCGGTHCRRTGEVGLIKIVRAERRGQETRIHFLCGWRALEDYAQKHAIVSALANHFTVAQSELVDAVSRLEDDARQLHRELKRAQERLADLEAAQLWADGEDVRGTRMVSRVLDDFDPQVLRQLAMRLAARGKTVALLAARGETCQVVFARSDDVGYDMVALLRQVAPLFGGRGGGQPHLAQGGSPDDAGLDEALRKAVALLKQE